MERIESYNQVLEAIKIVKDQKKGFITNFFPDENRLNLWIKKNILFVDHYSGTDIFIKENSNNFFNLYFISTDLCSLGAVLSDLNTIYQSYTLVFDILGKEPGMQNLKSAFENSGYFEYTSLQRMSKSAHTENMTGILKNVNSAKENQVSDIYNLLNKFFDPFAEQLPLLEEIHQWVKNQNIQIIEENNEIIGFVIYDLIGLTSYLRYWFVHPDHRNNNIGSALLRTYFNQSNKCDRQLFWVIQSNENAIKRYQHYGYKKENLIDYVMLNKKMKYERTNY
jgi:ribosomal protein S18 acetylase RimI-like enzyme